MIKRKWALGMFLGTMGLGLLLSAQAQTVQGGKGTPAGGKSSKTAKAGPTAPAASLKAGIASRAKLKEDAVEKMLKALGPTVSEMLRSGREVELPGVGVLRVVQVSEYKDLVNGHPATIPAKNYVEFVPNGSLNNDANAPGARPARYVEGYDFRVNPYSDPGIKTNYTRNPGTRTR